MLFLCCRKCLARTVLCVCDTCGPDYGRLPRMKYVNIEHEGSDDNDHDNDNDIAIDENLLCVICGEKEYNRTVTIFPCNHKFHTWCVITKKIDTCPQCGMSANPKSGININLANNLHYIEQPDHDQDIDDDDTEG